MNEHLKTLTEAERDVLLKDALFAANACLIAAAPDMLRELRAALRSIASMGADLEVAAPESVNASSYADDLRRINAVIAKAEGRA